MNLCLSLKWWLRMIASSLLAAFLIPYLEFAFGQPMNRVGFAHSYFAGFYYSMAIGGILSNCSPAIWRFSCRFGPVVKWSSRAAVIAAGTAVGCLLAGLLVRLMIGGAYDYWSSFIGSYRIGLVLSVFAVSFLAMYDIYKAQLQVTELQLKRNEAERQKALKLAAQATLSSLEARMHPHFLFNTINSILSLIHDDPKRAEKMLLQMADLLRFSLDSANSSLVPLACEMKIVSDYLEIEKARFEGRLRYELDIPAGLNSSLVPPLSVQTLVENSVKYAVSAHRNGASIQVRAFRAADLLRLEVIDDGPGFPPGTTEYPAALPNGHGLRNLLDRMQAIFGETAQLCIASSPAETKVAMQFGYSTAKV